MFSTLARYRLPIFLFSLCLCASLLLTEQVSYSQPLVNDSPQPRAPSPMTSKEKRQQLLTENVRQTVLENGLTVLTKEVHSAPVVSVQVWYKIGSRNEAPGVNGIAHQLEHMLFKGTKNRPVQFGRLFSALGSDSNAFTSYDQTAYFGTVERNKLSSLLVLEADRMQNALINAEQLASEKRVVISELQGYENSPGYRLNRAVKRAAFPNHPYGLTVGGTKADVANFTLDQVLYYYRNYYSPDNATLVIVGDFETEPTLQAVREIFGKVPKQESKGTNAVAPDSTIQTSRSRQSLGTSIPRQSLGTSKIQNPIVLREPGSAALLQAIYPLPNVNHPDVPALDVMDYILTEGRSSRLYQALVESGLASNVGGGAANLIAGGWYELSATAAPGKELGKIDDSLNGALALLRNSGVTQEELNRAKAQLRANVLLQNRDIASQAQQLGNDQTTTGDYRFTDRYLAGVQAVSAADVQRVAQTYLSIADRQVGFFEPTQATGKPSAGGATTPTQTSESFNLGEPVDPAELAKYLPKIDSSATSASQSLPEEFKLPNGLKVLLLPDRSTPTVTLSGHVQAGTEFDPKTMGGLASLTAENLMNGTKTRDALAIAKILGDRGASLGFSANREGVSIGGNALAADLPTIIQVLADVVQNATFPTDKLALSRQRALTALKVELDTPARLARRKFQQAIYPENHPFHSFPTEESLKKVARAEVEQFYKQHYQPNSTVLTLVGDFDPKAVRSLLENQFGTWKATGNPPTLNYPPVQLPAKLVKLNPVLTGKTQSVTYIGYKGIDRKDSRYYAALVLNQIVGGDTLSSRLGTEIRDRQGLTYGIYSLFQAGKYAGPFLIQMQTAPEDAERAIASTVALLQQIRTKGVTPAEVDAAKRSLASNYTVELANPDSLASQILLNEVYGLSATEIRDFTRKIQALTPEQVNQAAKDLLHPDNLVVVTAGPPLSASR